MKLKKVISGGQKGADRRALECAAALALETGGTAPKGWKVDGGADPLLANYGLVESYSSDYTVRTHQNAADADATVWFGKKSPGYYCTKNGCTKHKKPFYENPADIAMEYLANNYETLNFAGNRARINPGVFGLVDAAFNVIRRLMHGTAQLSPAIGKTLGVDDPRQEGERWCDHCQTWRGIVTLGSELDRCPSCLDWRWNKEPK